MAKPYAQARMIQNCKIILDNERAQCAVVDHPDQNNAGLGANPLKLRVMSHARCYSKTCNLVAGRMPVPLKSVEVKVESLKRQEGSTISEKAFYKIFNLDATEDQIRRLHEHPLRNCPGDVLLEKELPK